MLYIDYKITFPFLDKKENDFKSFNELNDYISSYNKTDKEKIMFAAKYSYDKHINDIRKSGEPYFIHPLNVAKILLDLKMDATSVVTGFLHDIVEDTNTPLTEINDIFGQDVAILVDSLTKIDSFSREKPNEIYKEDLENETVKKILIASSTDSRSIIIKLADKIHNMRTLEYMKKESQLKTAFQCIGLFSRLAEITGIFVFKRELEKIALKYIDRENYDLIDTSFKRYKNQNQNKINDIIYKIKNILKEDIEVDIIKNEKSYYSRYKEFILNHNSYYLENITDIYSIDIICTNRQECFNILSMLHNNYPHKTGFIKDYINNPKDNSFECLQTTLIIDDLFLEFHIFAKSMYLKAECGIMIKWSLLESNKVNIKDIENNLVKKALSLVDLNDLTDKIKMDNILANSIEVYVLNYKKSYRIPYNSTVIDLAYKISEDHGHSLLSAEINNKVVPIIYNLNKDQEIIKLSFQEEKKPELGWLNYIQSQKAKECIENWYFENVKDVKKLINITEINKSLNGIDTALIKQYIKDNNKDCFIVESNLKAGIPIIGLFKARKINVYERSHFYNNTEYEINKNNIIKLDWCIKNKRIQFLIKIDDLDFEKNNIILKIQELFYDNKEIKLIENRLINISRCIDYNKPKYQLELECTINSNFEADELQKKILNIKGILDCSILYV